MNTESDRWAGLTVESIDNHRLEVAAHGHLDRSCRPMLSERLARLVSCRPVTLRIDVSAVTFIDPEIADTFVRARSIVADHGGRLEEVGAAGDLAAALADCRG